MPDRIFTPHELHQKAISVLDQIERLAVDWRRGAVPAAAEIDVVTASVAELRAHVERTALELSAGDAVAAQHLAAARSRVGQALGLVDALIREDPGAAQRPRTPATRADGPPPPAG